MRGAKAKALRRLAKKSGLPEVVHVAVNQPVYMTIPPKDGKPKQRVHAYDEKKIVVGRSQRGMVQRAKKRIGNIPLVGLVRAERHARTEALKHMEIIPIDPPAPEAS